MSKPKLPIAIGYKSIQCCDPNDELAIDVGDARTLGVQVAQDLECVFYEVRLDMDGVEKLSALLSNWHSKHGERNGA